MELPADAGVGDPTTLPPGQRALPVEDNPEVLRPLVDLLRESRCLVIEAGDVPTTWRGSGRSRSKAR